MLPLVLRAGRHRPREPSTNSLLIILGVVVSATTTTASASSVNSVSTISAHNFTFEIGPGNFGGLHQFARALLQDLPRGLGDGAERCDIYLLGDEKGNRAFLERIASSSRPRLFLIVNAEDHSGASGSSAERGARSEKTATPMPARAPRGAKSEERSRGSSIGTMLSCRRVTPRCACLSPHAPRRLAAPNPPPR